MYALPRCLSVHITSGKAGPFLVPSDIEPVSTVGSISAYQHADVQKNEETLKTHFVSVFTMLYISAYTVVRAMCQVNGVWTNSAPGASEP